MVSVNEKLNSKFNHVNQVVTTSDSTDLYTAKHTTEGSKQLSEISITLLWMKQGKASNRFKIFLQAL